MKNWQLLFDFQHEITSLWNGEIVSYEDHKVRLKSQDYNKNIGVGESIVVGFIANWQEQINAPSNYKLFMNTLKPAIVEGCDISLNILSNWQQAFTGEICITNNTTESITDWALTFAFECNIQQLWNAKLVSRDEKYYVIEALDYNKEILPGATIYIGFMADPGDGDIEIAGYELSQKKQVVNTELDTPINLNVKKQANSLCLTWDDVENATTYEVEIDGEVVMTTHEPIYMDVSNKTNHQYIYRVRAKNSELTSEWSKPIKYINWQEGVPTILVTTTDDTVQEAVIVSVEANNIVDCYTILMTLVFEGDQMEVIEESLKTQLGTDTNKVYLAHQVKKNEDNTEIKVLVSLMGKQEGVNGRIQVIELRGKQDINNQGEIRLKKVQVTNSKQENKILTGTVGTV